MQDITVGISEKFFISSLSKIQYNV